VLQIYHISLGSNVGDRERNLRLAWEKLRNHGSELLLSSVYETEPMYVTDQPLFLNAVGRMSSALTPQEMLEALHEIESELGRDRGREMRMGPRTIDLDILLCGDLVLDDPHLTIPHPRILERAFVLIPLVEVSPQIHDPLTGARYADFLPEKGGGVYSYPRR
jgi:2-amino-4-hydroxy-6-hydroxymethyldihydropteridine diphosphokinase